MDDAREHENNETEDPPAPPYEPSPAHSPEYHNPIIQPAIEPVIPTIDEDHEDACKNEEAEALRAADNNNNSERYWCTINGLD
jgi:hypothetical protein